MEESHKCPGCGTMIDQSYIRVHIKKCNKYEKDFLRMAQKYKDSASISAIRFKLHQLDLAREYFEGILLEKEEEYYIEQNPHGYIQQPNIIGNYDDDIVSCNICNQKFYSCFDLQSLFYANDCLHLFCKDCVIKHIDQQFPKNGFVKCLVKECKKNIPIIHVKELIGNPKYQALQKAHQKELKKAMNIVTCANCKQEYEFTEGNAKDAPQKDLQGKALNASKALLYAKYRFVCPRGDCKTEQCKQCLAIPFHLGKTCEQARSFAQMKKCRYCRQPLTASNTSDLGNPALKNICKKKECLQLAKTACTKILKCGHSCSGTKNEQKCLPCLVQGCKEGKQLLNGQSGEDYCNICFVEALVAEPCIQSQCGHIFHLSCLKKRFEVKWLTPRIIFNFCYCPLCKKWLKTPKQNPLAPAIKENLELFQKLQKMALDRLKFEEREKDPKLKDPKSPYNGKPMEYAMAIYAYFMCFKCSKPYFGGEKSCAQAMNEAQNASEGFKASELVCPGCCQIPVENCPKHGKDFIEFKCKFCCSIAQWFCWGTTHFCEPCHKKQCSGDYVTKYPKDKLPKCQGPGKCPLGGKHQGNGQEKMLGCAICRNFKENKKNF